MSSTVIKAHYDGKHLVLDESIDLPTNQPLLVQLIAPDAEHSGWNALGEWSLSRAYGQNEPEYTTADLKPQ